MDPSFVVDEQNSYKVDQSILSQISIRINKLENGELESDPDGQTYKINPSNNIRVSKFAVEEPQTTLNMDFEFGRKKFREIAVKLDPEIFKNCDEEEKKV